MSKNAQQISAFDEEIEIHSQNKTNRKLIIFGIFIGIVFILFLAFLIKNKAKQTLIKKQSNNVQNTELKINKQLQSIVLPDQILFEEDDDQEKASEAFTYIYSNNIWDPEGRHPSGGGSIPQINIEYLLILQLLIDHAKIKKIVQIGFGDWNLMHYIKFAQNKQYIGFDVVKSLQRKNTSNMQFRIIDDIHEMNETGDLLIIKDVMMHWPNKLIRYFIADIMPRFKYAILSHCMTNSTRKDIHIGKFSAINLDFLEQKQLLFSKPNSCKRTFISPHWPS